MDKLIIETTEYSPEVILDSENKKFLISGHSRPDNARTFFQPILEWVDNYYSYRYFKEGKFEGETSYDIFEFRFNYFNSTSAKYILDIIKKLEKFNKEKLNFKIKWYYEVDDVDMKEAGKEFAEMTTIKFEFTPE